MITCGADRGGHTFIYSQAFDDDAIVVVIGIEE
jgi:hypothetical protein